MFSIFIFTGWFYNVDEFKGQRSNEMYLKRIKFLKCLVFGFSPLFVTYKMHSDLDALCHKLLKVSKLNLFYRTQHTVLAPADSCEDMHNSLEKEVSLKV